MENAQQLRPIGKLLADTWKFYQLNYKKVCLLMLWGLIGAVPYALIIAVNINFRLQIAPYQTVINLITFLFYLVTLYWIISTFLGLIILIKNPEKKIIDVFNAGRKLVWGHLAISLVVFMFVSLWSLLFVIPGIIFGIFYTFAMFAFVYDGYRRSAALGRSKELVSGKWWPVFGRLIIGLVIIMAFAMLYSFALRASQSSWLTYVILLIYYAIMSLLLSPLYVTYLSLIYNDLVAIKPVSSLPKEKNDYWLVAVATIFLIIVTLIFLSLMALAIMMLAAQTMTTGV